MAEKRRICKLLFVLFLRTLKSLYWFYSCCCFFSQFGYIHFHSARTKRKIRDNQPCHRMVYSRHVYVNWVVSVNVYACKYIFVTGWHMYVQIALFFLDQMIKMTLNAAQIKTNLYLQSQKYEAYNKHTFALSTRCKIWSWAISNTLNIVKCIYT